MANTSFKIYGLNLRRYRFGHPSSKVLPYGGITGSTHHNVVSPAIYPVGTIIEVAHTGSTFGSDGWSEFVYGRYAKDDGEVLVARDVLLPEVFTELFDFTGDPDECASFAAGFYAVIALSAMTDDYYGWFWSGGVCPGDLVGSDFAGSTTVAVTSAADVTAVGNGVIAATLGGSDNKIGLGVYAGITPPIGTTKIAAT